MFKWVPEIVYTYCEVPTTFTFSLPQGLWDLWSTGSPAGGYAVAESGVQESFEIRRDRGRRVHLRFWENEWLAVEDWIAKVHLEPQAFTFQFDKDLPATLYTVRLVNPEPGARVAPRRDPYNGLLSLFVEIRTDSGALIDLPFYEDTLMVAQ